MRPEWANGYVDYKRLKKMLKAMSKRAHNLSGVCMHLLHSVHSIRVATASAAAGTTHEFSEHTVYKAISVASASNLLQPKAPREADFFAASAQPPHEARHAGLAGSSRAQLRLSLPAVSVDKEISKVNEFASDLREKLLKRFQSAQAEHETWIKAGSDAKGLAQLTSRMSECSEALQRFEDFINLNYLAFSKM